MKPFNTFLSMSVLIFSACGGNDEEINNTEKPRGSELSIAVYNQAYNENYDSDAIEYILINAHNSYVLLDPFQENITEHIENIQSNGNEVGAYISIGTGEDWRADYTQMQPYLVTDEWGEWPGEYFVKYIDEGLVNIMKARIDQIAEWGCDWVEFDNMGWALVEEDRIQYGMQLTEAENIAYYQELCAYVHQKGMKCMAKNYVTQASAFDGVTYESYNNDKNWWDQSGAQTFLNDGKLVIIIHYNESNCNQVYRDYMEIYNEDLSYLCEDSNLEKYIHYND